MPQALAPIATRRSPPDRRFDSSTKSQFSFHTPNNLAVSTSHLFYKRQALFGSYQHLTCAKMSSSLIHSITSSGTCLKLHIWKLTMCLRTLSAKYLSSEASDLLLLQFIYIPHPQKLPGLVKPSYPSSLVPSAIVAQAPPSSTPVYHFILLPRQPQLPGPV